MTTCWVESACAAEAMFSQLDNITLRLLTLTIVFEAYKAKKLLRMCIFFLLWWAEMEILYHQTPINTYTPAVRISLHPPLFIYLYWFFIFTVTLLSLLYLIICLSIYLYWFCTPAPKSAIVRYYTVGVSYDVTRVLDSYLWDQEFII